MKIKFEQFTEPIETDIFEIQYKDIKVNLLENTFNVDVIFPESEQGVYFTFPICEMTKENIDKLVNNELKLYEI